MSSKKILIFMLELILVFFLSGCGTKGGTSIIEYSPKAFSETREIPILNLSSLTLRDGGTKLINVGTFPWGEFNKDGSDLHVLRESFEKTINNSNSLITQRKSPLNIHVIINRYLVAHSNRACAVAACVSWCITEENDNVLYDETFFAMSKGRILTTIGAIKNSTNKNIIARIIEKSLHLNQESPVTQVKNTSNDFNEIIKALPKGLASTDVNMTLSNLPEYAVFAEENITWDWVNYSTKINWKEYLRMQHSKNKI